MRPLMRENVVTDTMAINGILGDLPMNVGNSIVRISINGFIDLLPLKIIKSNVRSPK